MLRTRSPLPSGCCCLARAPLRASLQTAPPLSQCLFGWQRGVKGARSSRRFAMASPPLTPRCQPRAGCGSGAGRVKLSRRIAGWSRRPMRPSAGIGRLLKPRFAQSLTAGARRSRNTSACSVRCGGRAATRDASPCPTSDLARPSKPAPGRENEEKRNRPVGGPGGEALPGGGLGAWPPENTAEPARSALSADTPAPLGVAPTGFEPALPP